MSAPDRFDIFLSHATADKAWVRTLVAELEAGGLSVFLDEEDIRPGDNFVLTLSDAIRDSRFLVLILSQASTARPWVLQEWTSFMAEHSPIGRLIPVKIDTVEAHTILKAIQAIDATDRDAARVARELIAIAGRLADLRPGDARSLPIGQELVFALEHQEDHIRVISPDGRSRKLEPPWQVDNRFGVAYLGFKKLTEKPVETDGKRAELIAHARTLGEQLFDLLFDEPGLGHLCRAMMPGRPTAPRVTIRSNDDLLLSLPWELLCHEGSFLVRDGRVDVVRSTLGEIAGAAVLHEPTGHFKLVVNVSAPQGSGLNYEGESYRLTLALSEQCVMTPTELGTLDDLIETAKKQRPTGIHFSGHGGPGSLLFEDDEGREDHVPIDRLVGELRQRLPDRLPPFFYLASCHGNEPGSLEKGESGSESSAARLHRDGVAQVVGYYGPIADELSTRAEVALYGAIADGQTTSYAVRQARRALAQPFVGPDAHHRPKDEPLPPLPRGDRGGFSTAARDDPAASPAATKHTHPFAWAQLVLYHRGPDFPLSLPIDPAQRRREQVLQRTFQDAGDRRILATGFVGRRTELHRARRYIRQGRRIFVFQGLGGLGKSTLAFQVLPMLGQAEDICALWCQETEQQPDRTEALVGQLLEYCRRRFGADWEAVVQEVDQLAGDDSAKRFNGFIRNLLANVNRLVLYLDNLESLLVGPEDDTDEKAFGQWSSPQLEATWKLLAELARDGGKLHLVASCRYVNEDYRPALIPVSTMPPDALYRMMGWFPALQQVSANGRAQLVNRLAGHPRAVEYANDLVQDALDRWKDRVGPWRLPELPSEEDLEREWRDLIEPALPKVAEKLRANLLLAAIWDRVLDDPARRMLFRMTLLRGVWEWDLMTQLGEPEEPDATAEVTAERLRRTSLLEQVELFAQIRKDEIALVTRYVLHPSTVQFITETFGDDETIRLATHRRLGDYLEAKVEDSPYIETRIEAGHHLFKAGQYDRAYELLGFASEWLQNRGQVRAGLLSLQPLLAKEVQQEMSPALVGRLLGTVGRAYAELGQVEKAIAYDEQALKVSREVGDRRDEANTLGNLGNDYHRLGQAEKAIGYYEQQLTITREIGDRRGESAALGSLGNAYNSLGRMEEAIGNHEQALKISREIGDRRSQGNTLGNLGSAYAELGQVQKAIEYYEQQLAITREIGHRRGEGNAFGGLGNGFYSLGQMQKAIGYYEQHLAIAREIGDRRGEGTALGSLGNGYYSLGQVEKAIGHYEQRLAIAREIGDRRGEGAVLGNLGNAYADLGQVEKAIGLLEQAVCVGQEIKDPSIVNPVSAALERLRGGSADSEAAP